jgi:hypothetical protein
VRAVALVDTRDLDAELDLAGDLGSAVERLADRGTRAGRGEGDRCHPVSRICIATAAAVCCMHF